MDCRTLASRIPQVKLTHCYLEANKCVDALARKGPFNQLDFVIFDSSPVDISMFVFYDSIGMYYERFCPLISFPGLGLLIYSSFIKKKKNKIHFWA